MPEALQVDRLTRHLINEMPKKYQMLSRNFCYYRCEHSSPESKEKQNKKKMEKGFPDGFSVSYSYNLAENINSVT
jgi:hypothetical protein